MRDDENNEEADLVWGAAAIGRVISRTAAQVYYLHGIGALDGAVKKVSHKMMLGSRKRLLELPFREREK
jgi:hypothetical protein